MKKLFLSICAVLTLSAAQAAPGDTVVTLTNIRSYTSFSGRDYLRNVVVDSSILPDFNVNGMVNWNLKGKLRYDTTTFPVISRLYALSPAKYADSIPHKLGRIYFYGNNLTGLDITYSLYALGEALDSQNVYAARTTTGTDTLVIDDVTNYYMNAAGTGASYFYEMPLPLHIGQTWQNDYSHSVGFTLSDYLLGYNATPGKIYFRNTRIDSVLGQGTMKLSMPNGDTTKNITILKDKVISSERDSFVINGSPFPTPLLNILGVTQGMTTTTYSYCFYRAGRLSTPLMQVWYTNSSFTTVSKIWVDTTYIGTTEVPEVTNSNINITVYPNPVNDRVVNIDLPQGTTGSWTCELINIMGQQVAFGNLSSTGHTKVAIPSALPAGVYYLRINNNGSVVAVKPLTVK